MNIPEDWYNITRSARRQNPYSVIPLEYNTFMSFKSYTKPLNMKVDSEGNTVRWMKIRAIRLIKEFPRVMYFKYDFSEEYWSVNLLKISKRRKAGDESLKVVPTIRHKKIPISSAKKSDLVKLCKTGAIPGVFWSYYKSFSLIAQ